MARTLLEELLVKISGDVTTLRQEMARGEQVVRTSTSNMEKSFDKFRSGALAAAKKIGGALAAIFATREIVNFTTSTLASAEAIQRQSVALGSSAETIQELTFTFRQFDLDANDVADALATLADRAKDAEGGMKSFIDDFRLLGIEVDDLRGKKPDELFRAVAERVAEIEDPTRRTAGIVRIFGDDLGRKLNPLLMQGAAGLDEFADKAREANQVMSDDLIETTAKANEALRELREEAVGLLKEAVADLVVEWAAFFKLIELTPIQKLTRELRQLEERRDSRLFERVGFLSLGGDFQFHVSPAEIDEEIGRVRRELGRRTLMTPRLERPSFRAPPAGAGAAGDGETQGGLERIGLSFGIGMQQVKKQIPEWESILEDVTAEADTAAEEIEDRWGTLGSSMGHALHDSVTGALMGLETDFDEWLRRLAISAATSHLFSLLGALGGPVGTVFSFLGFGGGRAFGGPVMGGQPVLVGERRPEIFIPNSAGRIERSVENYGGALNIAVDARGAPDPAAVEAAVERGVVAAVKIADARTTARFRGLSRPAIA